MQFRHLPILALASLVAAQDSGNSTQSLNATLAGNDQLSNLTSFLSLNPALASALSQASEITILAPSNDAFTEFTDTDVGRTVAADPGLLSALLQYHVLNGTFQASQVTNQSAFIHTLLTNETYTNVTGGQVVEAVTVGNETVFYSGLLQNSTVTTADQNFTGGTIHIIDRVLTLPPSVLEAALALNLTSLYGALNATDSIDAATTRNITVFAPNNEAFNSIGSALANLSTDDLQSILEYHIVENVYYSTDLANGTTLQTESDDQDLTITTNENGTVFVNAAEVVVPNVLIANGVLHIVDNVLNPSNTAAPSASATAGAPGFTGSPASEQPFTSGQPTPTTQVDPSSEGAGPAQSTAAESESSGAAAPRYTGVEYVALVGAGAAALWGF
ncbi:FAS1 domain-containing protein [Karstenula rhodostoma CBS 690.94]|uniref:FAS1 domain-containing protein n=1 Tax=Karstenula rhodostoma CBS 690.94 TaxID=1392251 RepID=A0A9P4UB54_9PLEO|nr:FAS1 domain-containing protein [Karstenula rhodostoma CBS 690.94]